MLEYQIKYSKIKNIYIQIKNGQIIIKAPKRVSKKEIEKLIEQRTEAKKNKNFQLADEIRQQLLDKGIVLEDTRFEIPESGMYSETLEPVHYDYKGEISNDNIEKFELISDLPDGVISESVSDSSAQLVIDSKTVGGHEIKYRATTEKGKTKDFTVTVVDEDHIEIEGNDNKKYKPYENTGIKEGDTIIEINENKITSTQDLINKVNASKGNNVNLKYVHDQETKACSITPIKTSQNDYKLGLWVRDSAAGVGTVTFYEPETKSFGALGHGITDIDTEELINIESGEFITTKILNITKGESGTPGKIQGTVDNQNNIGRISKNTKFGIYGKVNNLSSLNINKSKGRIIYERIRYK